MAKYSDWLNDAEKCVLSWNRKKHVGRLKEALSEHALQEDLRRLQQTEPT